MFGKREKLVVYTLRPAQYHGFTCIPIRVLTKAVNDCLAADNVR